MKLTIKTLKNVIYNIEDINDDNSVLELKEKIEEASHLKKHDIKLVFNGQVLNDAMKILDYKILNNNTIVLMNITVNINKNIKPKEIEEVKEIKKNENTECNKNIEENIKKEESNKTKEKTDKKTKDKPEEFQYIKELKELGEMGFNGKTAEFALTISQGNIDTALDLLSDHVLLNSEELSQLVNEENEDDDFEIEGEEEEEEGDGEEGHEPHEVYIGNQNDNQEDDPNLHYTHEEDDVDPEEKLHLVASIAKVMCEDDKSKLTDVLLKLRDTYPEMLDLINEYSEDFEELFEAPITNQDREIYKKYLETVKNMNNNTNNNPNNIINNNTIQNNNTNNDDVTHSHQTGTENSKTNNEIILTEEEIECVNRLTTLGFTFKESKYAYIVCDKNEELAANFLFDNQFKNNNNNSTK